MLTRRTNAVLGAAAIALVGQATWLLADWGGPATSRMVTSFGALGFSTFAFCCAVRVALVSTGRRRRAWAAMSVGLLSWAIGDVVWGFYSVAHATTPPYPSISALPFLVLPVALIVTWSSSAPKGRLFAGVRPLLDGVIVACALFLVAWVMLVKDLLAETDYGNLWIAVSLASPASYIVLLTMGLLVLSSVPRAHRRPMWFVTTGVTALASGSCSLVYFNIHALPIGAVAHIEWNLGMVLIGAGALTALRSPPHAVTEREPAWSLFWLPYVPLPFAAAFGYVALSPAPGALPVLLAAAVLVAAALARQFGVLFDNRALLVSMEEQALRDPLTGVANRLLFADRLNHAMQMWERDGREVSVMSLDIDDFKLINDSLGHPLGDTLLKSVAERLQNVVPAGDTLARLGGDEFAVLMEGDGDAAEEVAQRVVEVFDEPFVLEGAQVYVHPSVGLASAPSISDGPISDDELFKRADLAMYTAKRAGVGGVQHFTSDMRHVDSAELQTSLSESERRRRTPLAGIQLLGQLRRAIDEDELTLVYQPKVSLSTGGVVGVEALIRWPHPEMGLLTPNQFLPLVRRNGLMGAVTDFVVDRAVRDAMTWYDADDCAVPVAINLFAPSLNDMSLPDGIAAALTRVGLPANALSVEITEHLLLANIRRASTVIERLRAIGLGIAIDDFGSGYSTMTYLRELHIDELKLDRQFVAPILHSERAAAIVRSVIDLAHTLGIVCVAEGVEDAATVTQLRDYGCDIAQGHFFSRPISAAAFRARCHVGCSSTVAFPGPN